MAQIAPNDTSAPAVAAANITAASVGDDVRAAAMKARPLSGSVTAPIGRATRGPRFTRRRSVSQPPAIVATAPVMSTMLERPAACGAVKPRASLKYVGSQ